MARTNKAVLRPRFCIVSSNFHGGTQLNTTKMSQRNPFVSILNESMWLMFGSKSFFTATCAVLTRRSDLNEFCTLRSKYEVHHFSHPKRDCKTNRDPNTESAIPMSENILKLRCHSLEVTPISTIFHPFFLVFPPKGKQKPTTSTGRARLPLLSSPSSVKAR